MSTEEVVRDLPAKVNQFNEEGYFIEKQLLTLDEVEKVKQGLQNLIKLWPDKLPPDVTPIITVDPDKIDSDEPLEYKIRRFFRMAVHDEFFKNLASHPKLVAIAKSLVGEDVKLLQSMALVKPPGTGQKRWHQDNAYFRLHPNKVMAFWIALDPSMVENGCMHVVPGSHKKGVVPHAVPPEIIANKDVRVSDRHIYYTLVNLPAKEEVVPLPMKPGDALVFHGELFHWTPPNVTKQPRRALQYHYATSHAKSFEPTPYWYHTKAELLVSGKDLGGGYI